MSEPLDAGVAMTPDADARRLALEAIATLTYVKRTAADQLLRRAGVPEDLIRRFLTERDPATGEKRSKRDAGALVLDELARAGRDHEVVRNLVAIAADWSAFHLAQDEYKARAVVQKARELRGALAEADVRERAAAEARREAAEQQRRNCAPTSRASASLAAPARASPSRPRRFTPSHAAALGPSCWR